LSTIRPINKRDFRYQISTPTPTPQRISQIISKLDLMRKENDSMRRKYEKLNFEDDLFKKSKYQNDERMSRRRYEECYLLKDDDKEEEEEDNDIHYENIYHQLKPPPINRLSAVIDYSQKFDEFNQKINVTSIGNKKYDDFELFEELSEELFDTYLKSIYNELDDVNNELTNYLVNAELSIKDEKVNEDEDDDNESNTDYD
jgi:hypothetical protein